MTGRTVKLSDYRGRPVMLVFWGLGCRLCKTEAPHLSELYEKYKDRGLVILAVESFDTDPADVAGYLRENKLRHPVLTGGAQVSSRTYNIGGLPRAFWIDKRGNVVGRQVGFDSKEALERKAEELLAQP
jgi:thiol-disulfide isomerase/thioredoxin